MTKTELTIVAIVGASLTACAEEPTDGEENRAVVTVDGVRIASCDDMAPCPYPPPPCVDPVCVRPTPPPPPPPPRIVCGFQCTGAWNSDCTYHCWTVF